MIIRARAVVGMDGPPIDNGAIAIQAGRISDIGAFADVRSRNAGPITDLGECALLPGLINAHCHLDYTALAGRIAPPSSFTAWIQEINARKATLAARDYVAAITAGFEEAARFGTTSLVNFEAFPNLIAEIPLQPVRTWWCAELIDLRSTINVEEIAARLARGSRHWSGGIGLAPHALFTASAELYRQCQAAAAGREFLLTTHLAESRDEMALFRQGAGPLEQFLRALGRPMEDAGRGTPLAQMRSRVSLDSRWIVAHLNELAEEDFALLTQSDRFHIVHCPRSHRYFGHRRFDFARLHNLGFTICVGTDSLASNSDLSLLAELRELMRAQPEVTPAAALQLVTIAPARALNRARDLGRLRVGFCADAIAVPLSGGGDVYERIVTFDGVVPWTMINGRITRSIC